MPRPLFMPRVARLVRLALTAALTTTLAVVTPSHAQQAIEAATPPTSIKLPANAAAVPFAVGEKLEYDVKFSFAKVGTGVMEVKEITELKGAPVWHTVFGFSGGIPLYRVNDRYESWFDVVTLSTRRYFQDISEGNYKPKRHYEFFPDRGMYQENAKPEQVTVAEPLDDGSFLYFVRTIPLEVGKSYSFSRYFNPDANPVVIKVLRKDTIDVPAGRFTTFVLQPTFRTKSLVFSEKSHAEVWITDDSRRMMVQMKSALSIGSINLYLKRHNTKTPPTENTNR